MVYCVQAWLAFSTAQRRDQALNAIQTRISGKQRWGVDVLGAEAQRVGSNALTLELRFTSQLDAEDLVAAFDQLTGNSAPIAGSTARLHSCSTDEGTNACVVLATRTW